MENVVPAAELDAEGPGHADIQHPFGLVGKAGFQPPQDVHPPVPGCGHAPGQLDDLIQGQGLHEAFADAVATGRPRHPGDGGAQKPRGRERRVLGFQQQRPHRAVLHGPVVLEEIGERVMLVPLAEKLPGLGHGGGLGLPPVDRRQPVQEFLLVLGKGLEGEQAGGFVHQPRVVAEVPAQHGARHPEFSHAGEFLVEQGGHRHKGNCGHFVGRGGLDLRRDQ